MTRCRVWIANWIYWTLYKIVPTGNNNCSMDLHALKITATTAHIKTSMSSLAIVW
jgi:hypothetical protein